MKKLFNISISDNDNRLLKKLVLSCAVLFLPKAGFAATLEEVVVTAQKREQSANDVGITLNVYSGDELDDLRALEVMDIAFITPGVSLSGSAAGQTVSFAVRGVTQQDFASIAEPPNAVYLDEGYYAGNSISGLGFFDIGQVEVLKGPQGTLFGRNATGGLVNIKTRKPTEEFEGYVSAGAGSFNTAEFEAAVGGSITENMQGRIAGVYRDNGAWLDNANPNGDDIGNSEQTGVRTHLAIQASENFSVLLTGYYNELEQSWGPYFTFPSQSTLVNGIPNAVETAGPTAFGTFASDFEDMVINSDSARDDGNYNRVGGGTIKLDWDLGWGELTSITDYKSFENQVQVDNDAETGVSFIDSLNATDTSTISQEFRLFKEFDWGNITTGLYYLNIDADGINDQLLYFVGLHTFDLTTLETDSYSFFGQAEYQLSENLTFIGGVRVTRESKDYDYESFGFALDSLVPPATDVGAAIPLRTINDKLSDDLYSWKAQLQYQPRENLLMYASYNRGTKGGNFNVPFAGGALPIDADVPYRPEKLDAYEVGVKMNSEDGKLRATGSVFYYDYTDYQSFALVNLASIVANQPADIIGVELEGDYEPTESFLLKAGITYLDAEIKEVGFGNALGSAIADRRPPFTSELDVFALARYTVNLSSGSLAFQLSGKYVTDSYFAVSNFSSTRIKPHGVMGARIAWTSTDQKWEVSVQGENITDKRYRTVGFDLSDFGNLTEVGYGRPREFSGTIKYSF